MRDTRLTKKVSKCESLFGLTAYQLNYQVGLRLFILYIDVICVRNFSNWINWMNDFVSPLLCRREFMGAHHQTGGNECH
jgi:hypothetical protein